MSAIVNSFFEVKMSIELKSLGDLVKLVFYGNPGVGKSTIINGYINAKYPDFDGKFCGSGLSLGKGFTAVNQYIRFKEEALIDTPGLGDVKLREQAANEITNALKQDGQYKIIFVCTLEMGRIRAGDITTMSTVLEAIGTEGRSQLKYSIIVNNIGKRSLKKIVQDPQELTQYFAAFKNYYPNTIAFIPCHPDANEEDNYIIPENEQKAILHSGSPGWEKKYMNIARLIEEFPMIIIEPSQVQKIDFTAYEKKVEAMELQMKEIAEANKLLSMQIKQQSEHHNQLQLEKDKSFGKQMSILQETNKKQQEQAKQAHNREVAHIQETNRKQQEHNRKIAELQEVSRKRQRQHEVELANIRSSKKTKGKCICGTGIVITSNGLTKKVKDVVIGDSLLLSNGMFSTVFLTHQDPSGPMFQIQVESNGIIKSIILSSMHLLFTINSEYIAAKNIMVGDNIMMSSGTLGKCISIKIMENREAFSIFTYSGELDVNGVRVSSFTVNTIKLIAFLPLARALSYIIPLTWLKPIAYDGFYRGLNFINSLQKTTIISSATPSLSPASYQFLTSPIFSNWRK